MPENTHRQADQVLLSFRKRRSTPACYPCSKRKVRCRGGRPCDACRARGHTDICQDEDTPKRRRLGRANSISGRDVARSGASSLTPSDIQKTLPPPSTAPSTVREPVVVGPSVGKFSAINFVRDRLCGSQRTHGRDIHPSIGLGNTDHTPPVVAPLHAGSSDDLTPPTREEVIQYFPPFRDHIIVLYPFVQDIVALESTLYSILQDSSKVGPQHIAVALAALALGAQFAEVVTKPRREIAREFVNRANAYLHQANYIFHPTPEVVQTLLMVGMSLQNCGQSDGAWALLGLNYRLAQTLGFHALQPHEGAGGMLWTALIWQDALISLRYDRQPLSHGISAGEMDQGQNLSYYQALRSCCLVSIDMLQKSPSQRVDVGYVLESITRLDDTVARCCDHLQPRDIPRTFQQRLQCVALQLHSSLCLAEICRPIFSIPGPQMNESHSIIRQRGLNALVTNIEVFLELCTFSNVPLRLWSMTQAAVSCALVLALLDSQSSTLPFWPLLQRLLNALKMDTGGADPVTSLTPHRLEGVCLLRVKAAGLLESILSNATPASSVGSGTITPQPSQDPVAMPSEKLPGAEDLTWPTDFSLFDRAFADSVLDFDLDPGWYSSINWHD